MRTIQIIGHRGAKDEAPENTVSGFRYAKGLGLTAVELDVRLTRDDEPVVIHDATVDRTTNASGAVSELTAAELAALDARGTCPGWTEQVGIPSLCDVLESICDLATIQIEFKSDTPTRLEKLARRVLQQVQDRSIASRVILSSFDPVALEVIGRLAPEQNRAFIGTYDHPHFLDTALRLGCMQVDISFESGSADAVQQAHAHGLNVVGWQCNSAANLERALAWGVNAATSDVPSDILPMLHHG